MDSQALVGNFKNVKYTKNAIRGRLRESLAEGIYQDVSSSFHVLRELVQNGVDAIKDFRKETESNFEGEIRIRLSAASIEVFDTGIGMSKAEMRDLVAFGATKKDPDFHVGFRGIGFWANSTLASKVLVISKKRGEKYKHTLLVDVEGWKKEEATLPLLDLLNTYVFEDDPSREDPDEHYTLIRLTGLTESGKYLVEHQAEAEKYLRRTLPLEFADFKHKEKIKKLIYENLGDYEIFRVYLGHTELFKPGYDNLQDVIFDEIRKPGSKGRKNDNPVIGWYWAALNTARGEIKDRLARGILFRAKGFAIGDENLLRSLFSTDQETIDWYYGEIYVLDNKILPDSSRTHFEGNPAWLQFVSALTATSGLINKLKKERRSFSSKDIAREKIPNLVEATKTLVENQASVNRSEVEKVKEELQKRLPFAPDPELKKEAQESIKQLEKALVPKQAKTLITSRNSSKQASPINHFYTTVLQVLRKNISDSKLLKRIEAEVTRIFEEVRSTNANE